MVKPYCASCHSDRGKAGGLTLAAFDAAQVTEHADVSEKMIRKLRAGMMPPAGAKRPDEAALLQLASGIESRDRSRRGAGTQSGLTAVPAPQSRRVRPRRARHAEHRRRRRVAPASRHDQPRLRQHRRRADDDADGARSLSAGGGQGQPRRAGRSDDDADVDDLPGAAHGGAAVARRRRADGHARRHLGRARVSGGWRVSLPHDDAQHPDRAAVRQHDARRADRESRSTACARRCSTSTRA